MFQVLQVLVRFSKRWEGKNVTEYGEQKGSLLPLFILWRNNLLLLL